MNKQDKGNGKRGIEWRPVVGYEEFYVVSSDGQIRSLKRNHIMTPQLNNSGYLRVSISGHGHKYLYVHHLVAAAFVSPRPVEYDVNHINGVKTDNRAENLEYVTRTQNMYHARRLGLHDNRGEKHYGSKLSEDGVRWILLSHSLCGVSAWEMSASLGVAARTVQDVLERKTWRHIQ